MVLGQRGALLSNAMIQTLCSKRRIIWLKIVKDSRIIVGVGCHDPVIN